MNTADVVAMALLTQDSHGKYADFANLASTVTMHFNTGAAAAHAAETDAINKASTGAMYSASGVETAYTAETGVVNTTGTIAIHSTTEFVWPAREPLKRNFAW